MPGLGSPGRCLDRFAVAGPPPRGGRTATSTWPSASSARRWSPTSSPARPGLPKRAQQQADALALLVEVEVAAVKGAHAGLEWIGPDAVDPLDGGGAWASVASVAPCAAGVAAAAVRSPCRRVRAWPRSPARRR